MVVLQPGFRISHILTGGYGSTRKCVKIQNIKAEKIHQQRFYKKDSVIIDRIIPKFSNKTRKQIFMI